MELRLQPLPLRSLGIRSLELLLSPGLQQSVHVVRTLPEEQNESDAAFSLCHTHSAISLWTWWGEEGGGWNLKERP